MAPIQSKLTDTSFSGKRSTAPGSAQSLHKPLKIAKLNLSTPSQQPQQQQESSDRTRTRRPVLNSDGKRPSSHVRSVSRTRQDEDSNDVDMAVRAARVASIELSSGTSEPVDENPTDKCQNDGQDDGYETMLGLQPKDINESDIFFCLGNDDTRTEPSPDDEETMVQVRKSISESVTKNHIPSAKQQTTQNRIRGFLTTFAARCHLPEYISRTGWSMAR